MKSIIVTLLLTHLIIGNSFGADHAVSNAKALSVIEVDIAENQPQLQTKTSYGNEKFLNDYTSKQTAAECCRYSCYSCTERTINSWCCLPCITACVCLKKCCVFNK